MHYGLNVAVRIQQFIMRNTVFLNITMLPLWHILNIKESKSIVIENVEFDHYRF